MSDNRKEAIEIIESLYGFDDDDIREIVRELGFDAFSDDALEIIARRQELRERSKCLQP